jgi:hypothetical protein
MRPGVHGASPKRLQILCGPRQRSEDGTPQQM